MRCKCDEIGDYALCWVHGVNSDWAKREAMTNSGEPKRGERVNLLIAAILWLFPPTAKDSSHMNCTIFIPIDSSTNINGMYSHPWSAKDQNGDMHSAVHITTYPWKSL